MSQHGNNLSFGKASRHVHIVRHRFTGANVVEFCAYGLNVRTREYTTDQQLLCDHDVSAYQQFGTLPAEVSL
jgi:hypothetical protein